jgi:hypothetical protein
LVLRRTVECATIDGWDCRHIDIEVKRRRVLSLVNPAVPRQVAWRVSHSTCEKRQRKPAAGLANQPRANHRLALRRRE